MEAIHGPKNDLTPEIMVAVKYDEKRILLPLFLGERVVRQIYMDLAVTPRDPPSALRDKKELTLN